MRGAAEAAAAHSPRIWDVRTRGRFKVLCLGAHCDDIEIGCGGTILALAAQRALECHWVVFSGAGGPREREARVGARRFLRAARETKVVVHAFRDGYFPVMFGDIKERFEAIKSEISPDLVFTHYRDDRHQDHRVVSDLTWNTFRNHCILEYEIPKYDGDLGRPNLYAPLTPATVAEKVRHLMTTFGSQRTKQWFTPDTFRGIMRLRGIESGAPEGYAEAFHGRKLLLATGAG
jgi:LmbE family N-acetylglucosaminyl deacetylase